MRSGGTSQEAVARAGASPWGRVIGSRRDRSPGMTTLAASSRREYMALSAAGARRVVVGDGRYVRTQRARYKRPHSVVREWTILCQPSLQGPLWLDGEALRREFGARYREGRRSWHCRKITFRSMRIPPGPSTQMSTGCCLKTVQAKSIALEGTG
jgi:hypothetical protein